MKKTFFLLAAVTALMGCELISPEGDLDTKRSSSESGSEASDSTATEETEPLDTALYVTGVSYPEGYYWQRDTAYGVVERTLVLYKDSTLIVEIPVGDEYYATADSDMHRAAGGHLYTDFSTESETVVCKDGEEAFRYTGREMMRGFLVKDGNVYTLGLDRSGTGVTYRRNGVLLYEREDAVPVGETDSAMTPGGALYEDEGKICFTLYDSSYFYRIADGEEESVRKYFKNTKQEVQDVRMVDGTICRAVVDNRYSVMSPTLAIGYEVYYLGGTNDDGHSSDRLRVVYGGGNYYIKGEYTDSDSGLVEDRLWAKDKTWYGPGAGYDAYDFCVDGDSYAYVAAMDGELAFIDMGGAQFVVDGRWRLTNRKCMTMWDGSLYVALTPIDADQAPELWQDGVVWQMPLNGYLTGVTMEVN